MNVTLNHDDRCDAIVPRIRSRTTTTHSQPLGIENKRLVRSWAFSTGRC